MHNYKPSPIQGIKIVSVLQRLHGEIGRTNSDVQKHKGQTDRQKTQREPHQTWQGDRGHRARSCTSKTSDAKFLPLGGAENLG